MSYSEILHCTFSPLPSQFKSTISNVFLMTSSLGWWPSLSIGVSRTEPTIYSTPGNCVRSSIDWLLWRLIPRFSFPLGIVSSKVTVGMYMELPGWLVLDFYVFPLYSQFINWTIQCTFVTASLGDGPSLEPVFCSIPRRCVPSSIE